MGWFFFANSFKLHRDLNIKCLISGARLNQIQGYSPSWSKVWEPLQFKSSRSTPWTMMISSTESSLTSTALSSSSSGPKTSKKRTISPSTIRISSLRDK